MLFYVIARKRAVFALRAEFSSLSFPKEKGTKKKGNLRACALKNPPHCTELLRSIKNGMFVVAAITGRALRGEIVRDGGRREVGATNGRRRVCTEITLNVPEPSPRGGGFGTHQNFMST